MTGLSCRGAGNWLLRSAAARMRRKNADWAAAMAAEAEACSSDSEKLRWAWGCWITSLRLSGLLGWAFYAAALGAGLLLMTAYEWQADESLATLAVLCLICVLLGILSPGRAPLSGALLGSVVACVLGFEALSGIRPGYEAQAQTLVRSLMWTVLLVPGLASAVMGARIGRRFHPACGPE
jgi:hypothetical protein